jgi:signal transduction histidine kinase
LPILGDSTTKKVECDVEKQSNIWSSALSPADKKNDQSNDENGTEYPAANVHVNLRLVEPAHNTLIVSSRRCAVVRMRVVPDPWNSRSLAELNRCKDEFLAMLSHELRNPLASIRNATHLLRRQRDRNSMQVKPRE